MASYREQSEKAKAARREPAPDKMANVPSKSRKAKPVMRWGVYRLGGAMASANFGNKPWQEFETKEQAEEWVDKRLRSIHVPKNSTWTFQEQVDKERARWAIKELK